MFCKAIGATKVFKKPAAPEVHCIKNMPADVEYDQQMLHLRSNQQPCTFSSHIVRHHFGRIDGLHRRKRKSEHHAKYYNRVSLERQCEGLGTELVPKINAIPAFEAGTDPALTYAALPPATIARQTAIPLVLSRNIVRRPKRSWQNAPAVAAIQPVRA